MLPFTRLALKMTPIHTASQLEQRLALAHPQAAGAFREEKLADFFQPHTDTFNTKFKKLPKLGDTDEWTLRKKRTRWDQISKSLKQSAFSNRLTDLLNHERKTNAYSKSSQIIEFQSIVQVRDKKLSALKPAIRQKTIPPITQEQGLDILEAYLKRFGDGIPSYEKTCTKLEAQIAQQGFSRYESGYI